MKSHPPHRDPAARKAARAARIARFEQGKARSVLDGSCGHNTGRGLKKWARRVLNNTVSAQSQPRHGTNCEKVTHDANVAYLHAADDNSPYVVDGLTYCGRCHHWIQT